MKLLVLHLVLMSLAGPVGAAPVSVVTTTTDIADIVRRVGKDRVTVKSLCSGKQDPHTVEPRPSFLTSIKGARLLVAIGLGYESSWLDPIRKKTENVGDGKTAYLELGPLLNPRPADGEETHHEKGHHAHAKGNPHLLVDPMRAVAAADIIAARLSELDPDGKTAYQTSAKNLKALWKELFKKWADRVAKTGVTQVVTGHKSLDYFFMSMGMAPAVNVESIPGVPPSAAHLLKLKTQIKDQKIRLFLVENTVESPSAEKFKAVLGPSLKTVPVVVTVGGSSSVGSLEDVYEGLVRAIELGKAR